MNSASARLYAITRDLRQKWTQTRESWRDSKSAEFDARYMQELFATVDRSMEVISELDKLVQRIRKDCE